MVNGQHGYGSGAYRMALGIIANKKENAYPLESENPSPCHSSHIRVDLSWTPSSLCMVQC